MVHRTGGKELIEGDVDCHTAIKKGGREGAAAATGGQCGVAVGGIRVWP